MGWDSPVVLPTFVADLDARKVKALIAQQGLDLDKLAAKIGKKRSTLQAVLALNSAPSNKLLRDVAAALSVTVEDITTRPLR